MKPVFLTFILTSIFWLCVHEVVYNNPLLIERLGLVKTDNNTMPAEDVVENSTPSAQTPTKNYSELILGYWVPIEGNTYHLEITKYGTVIQWRTMEHAKHKYERQRSQYTIDGNMMTIGKYANCTIDVIEEGGATFLEVYGDKDFSGKYRKSK